MQLFNGNVPEYLLHGVHGNTHNGESQHEGIHEVPELHEVRLPLLLDRLVTMQHEVHYEHYEDYLKRYHDDTPSAHITVQAEHLKRKLLTTRICVAHQNYVYAWPMRAQLQQNFV